MTPYLILSWQKEDAQAHAAVQRVRTTIDDHTPDWRLLIDQPGTLIAIGRNDRAIATQTDGFATVIIGDVFARSGADGEPLNLLKCGSAFDTLCGQLATDYWGAYLAVQVRDGQDISVFRDPVGMRDGVHWTASDIQLFASDTMPWIMHLAPPELAIDWCRLAALLLDDTTLSESPPLSGIATIPAGAILTVCEGRATTRRLWSPAAFYQRERPKLTDAAMLRDTIVDCTTAWAASYPDTMLEISGGLDSAIVAAAVTTPHGAIKRGINFFTDQLSGDERRYARATSAHCRIPLDEVFMPVGRLSEGDLKDLPVGARPGLNSASLFHDRLLTRIAADHGTKALFTGHGGDSVLFQIPTALIAADPAFPRTDLRAYATLAKWSKESVWTVAGYACGLRRRRRQRRSGDDNVVALPLAKGIRAAPSEWAGELDHLPPAKRLHVTAIATDRSVFGPSWRSQAMTMVHPLLSQPLVELAIATDVFTLTAGRRDRALARAGFSDLLPAVVVDRMGKGTLSIYFGQCFAASVAFLRAYLLDGLLAGNHILDRTRLEPMLKEDYLMQFDCYVRLRAALIMEHWARVWEQRLTAIRAGRSDPGAASPSSHPAT